MMQRLTAEESLVAAERVAVGSGALRVEDARAINRRWRQAAGADIRARVATSADFKRAGIGVRHVPHKAKPATA